MMRFGKRFQAHCKKQGEYLEHNLEEADRSNRRLLYAVLCVACIAFTLFLLCALFLPHFRALLLPYAIQDVVLLLALALFNTALRRVPATALIYAVGLELVGFCIFTNIAVLSDAVCVVILFFLLLLPVVTLDKMGRVHFFLLLCTALYLGASLPFKAEAVRLDEVVNCLLAASIGAWLGDMLRHIRLENMELRRLSCQRELIDELTGLLNRRSLFRYFSELGGDARCTERIGLFIVDLDWFKAYNDTYGHQAGDRCLRTVAACFEAFGHDNGFAFYRYGGEEFVAVSNGRSPIPLPELAKKLARAVAALRIPHEGSPNRFVTVSIGATQQACDAEHVERRLLSEADTALYAAKSRGRNCAVFFEPEMEPLQKEVQPSFHV